MAVMMAHPPPGDGGGLRGQNAGFGKWRGPRRGASAGEEALGGVVGELEEGEGAADDGEEGHQWSRSRLGIRGCSSDATPPLADPAGPEPEEVPEKLLALVLAHQRLTL